MILKIKRFIDCNKRNLGVSFSMLNFLKVKVLYALICIFHGNCKMSIFKYLKHPNILEFINVWELQKFRYFGVMLTETKKILFRINVSNTIQFKHEKSLFAKIYVRISVEINRLVVLFIRREQTESEQIKNVTRKEGKRNIESDNERV